MVQAHVDSLAPCLATDDTISTNIDYCVQTQFSEANNQILPLPNSVGSENLGLELGWDGNSHEVTHLSSLASTSAPVPSMATAPFHIDIRRRIEFSTTFQGPGYDLLGLQNAATFASETGSGLVADDMSDDPMDFTLESPAAVPNLGPSPPPILEDQPMVDVAVDAIFHAPPPSESPGNFPDPKLGQALPGIRDATASSSSTPISASTRPALSTAASSAPDSRTHACADCVLTFASRTGLTRHRRGTHGPPRVSAVWCADC